MSFVRGLLGLIAIVVSCLAAGALVWTANAGTAAGIGNLHHRCRTLSSASCSTPSRRSGGRSAAGRGRPGATRCARRRRSSSPPRARSGLVASHDAAGNLWLPTPPPGRPRRGRLAPRHGARRRRLRRRARRRLGAGRGRPAARRRRARQRAAGRRLVRRRGGLAVRHADLRVARADRRLRAASARPPRCRRRAARRRCAARPVRRARRAPAAGGVHRGARRAGPRARAGGRRRSASPRRSQPGRGSRSLRRRRQPRRHDADERAPRRAGRGRRVSCWPPTRRRGPSRARSRRWAGWRSSRAART